MSPLPAKKDAEATSGTPATPSPPKRALQLARVQIKNYRNFREIDAELGPHVVLFGENGAGKSNFLRALRLVLDPDLPDSERQLDADDFWRGVPPFAGNEITIALDFTGFASDTTLTAILGDHVVDTGPAGVPVARLTFHFAPKGTIPEAERATTGRDDYEFSIYGGDDPSDEVDRQVRRYLPVRVLGALRDAEADLRTWRRSPLRPLLEFVQKHIDHDDLVAVAAKIDEAAQELVKGQPFDLLQSEIARRLGELIGNQHDLEPTLGFASTDADRILNSLRLFVDKRLRLVSDTSLGLANVLYLTLILLHAELQEAEKDHAALLLAIEEPEAHIHPHLQRAVFRDLLTRKSPVLVSTHSPNIASVTPLPALVLVRVTGNESQLVPFASAKNFSTAEVQDLERYLDVTRAEMLFARGIILVEGEAEKYLVPAAAALMSPTMDLDHLGISICSVAGIDFVPYAKLLACLGIPYVIITDGDSREGVATPPGVNRGKRVLAATGSATTDLETLIADGNLEGALDALAEEGVFVGTRTLESDLFAEGAGSRMKAAFLELRKRTRIETAAIFDSTATLTDASEDTLIDTIERVGKGRFAQRFAAHLTKGDVPTYVTDAIQAIADAVRRKP